MGIPYYILAILYGIALLVALFFYFVNLYHLKRFGFLDFSGKTQSAMVGGIFVIVIIFTIIFLRHINWTDEIEVFGNYSINVVNEVL